MAKVRMSSQQISVNKVTYFCCSSVFWTGSALKPGPRSAEEDKDTTPAGLSPPYAVTTLRPLFPTGGGTHPEVMQGFPSETALFY